LPGAQTQVEWTVPFVPGEPTLELFAVVDGEAGNEAVLECDEDNNDATTASAACPVPG